MKVSIFQSSWESWAEVDEPSYTALHVELGPLQSEIYGVYNIFYLMNWKWILIIAGATKDRHHFFEMLAYAFVVTPNDMVMGLAAFKEGSAGTEGNLIKHFTNGYPRADAAFKQMTFGGKVAVSKILRALLKNQD